MAKGDEITAKGAEIKDRNVGQRENNFMARGTKI